MKKNILIVILLSTITFSTNFGQTTAALMPEVGKPIPAFALNKITHYKTKEASSNDFKGKWLFLDFWFTGCIACIKSFPKINSFQQEFKDKAVFMLVGFNDFRNPEIEILYEKLAKNGNFQLAAAYDSIIADRWEIGSMPHIVVVDPQGIVRSITGGRNMTREKLKDLFDGKKVSFYPKDIPLREFDPISLDSANLKNDNLLYRSVLAGYNGERQEWLDIDMFAKWPAEYLKLGWKAAMIPLYAYYNNAYFGRGGWSPGDSLYGLVYPFPILEVRDSSLFQFDFINDVGKGTYNYNVVMPVNKVSKKNLMKFVQLDLKAFFGYDVFCETRNIPTWELVAKPGAVQKLKSKGGQKSFGKRRSRAAGFSGTNITPGELLDAIMYHLGDHKTPYFDKTGIQDGIDINFDVILTDKEAVKKELRKYDLEIIRGSRPMKVIVIRDPVEGN